MDSRLLGNDPSEIRFNRASIWGRGNDIWGRGKIKMWDENAVINNRKRVSWLVVKNTNIRYKAIELTG